MQDVHKQFNKNLPLTLRRGARGLVNSILGLFNLKIVRAHYGVEQRIEQNQQMITQNIESPSAIRPAWPNDKDSVNDEVAIPFGMVVPSVYGPIIVNRHDINQTNALVKTGRAFHHNEIKTLCGFLSNATDGAVCLDVGANYGLYALAFARRLSDKNGVCHAFEAQRIIAAMIGGTAVLNGVKNLYVHHSAVGNQDGSIPIPGFDYNKELNFGSVEFGSEQRELLSQNRMDSYVPDMVKQVRIDDLNYKNVHLIKMDIEGMEEQAIEGARETIARDLPVMCIEWIKSDKNKLVNLCKGFGFDVFDWEGDLLCIHPSKKQQYPMNINLVRL